MNAVGLTVFEGKLFEDKLATRKRGFELPQSEIVTMAAIFGLAYSVIYGEYALLVIIAALVALFYKKPNREHSLDNITV
ncbi:Uncharacterised protein [Candidatus Norongarragalina meridionalis]|nr:Uncharacterised protein [Candidatus Norongarragalina meridionalis]